MQARAGRRSLLLLLALASGTLMVAAVGFGLVRNAREGRDRAELAARRDARDLGSAVRAALRMPAVLELVPAAAQFEVHAGDVLVDADVGWLAATVATPPDVVIDERMRRAQLAEFVQHDAAAAAAQFDELRGVQGPTGEAALAVLAAAAWQAQRAADTERLQSLVPRLMAGVTSVAIGDVADPRVARALTSTALLLAAEHAESSPLLDARLAALPPELAEPMLARLRERGIEVVALASTSARIAARRERLATVSRALRDGAERATATACGERLLLWFPGDRADRGDGRGALVDRSWLPSLLGLGTSRECSVPALPPLTDRGRFVFVGSDADAEPIVPGLAWIEPAALPELPWSSRPSTLLVAGCLLVLVFVGSALSTWRGMRRESLLMRARADFLTGVTHELKTPIAAIRLVADVLTDDDVPAQKQREYFALLAGEAARLSMLIENVLDLGQMERGERAYDPRPVDLVDIVRDTMRLFAPLAARAGMQVVSAGDTTPAPTVADRSALTQALLNLCENARKYAAAGQRLDVTTTRDGAVFTIRLRDYGPGVPRDEHDAIFERFQRGRGHRHGSIPGVGLGLFLARAIVEHHGGSLRCEAPPEGPGAGFVCTLPLVAESRP